MKTWKLWLGVVLVGLMAGCGQQTAPTENTDNGTVRVQATSYKYFMPFEYGVSVVNDYGNYHWNAGTGDGLILDLYTNGVNKNIVAMRGGTVAEARTGRVRCTPCGNSASLLYGNLVIVNHGDGTYALYAHLDSVNVATGQTVTTGQLLGVMGETGNTYGAHLHLELRSGANADNSYVYSVAKTLPSFVEAQNQEYQRGVTYVSQNTGETLPPCSSSNGGQGHNWSPSGGWTSLWGDDDGNGNFFRDTFEADRNTFMQYWWKDGSNGGGGDSWFTYANNVGAGDQNYAYWRFIPPSDGEYDIYVYVPNGQGTSGYASYPTSRAPNVKYRLNVSGGAEIWNTRVDQGAQGGCWVRLSADNRLNPTTMYSLLVADGDTDTSNRRIYWDSAAIKLKRIFQFVPTASVTTLTLPAGTVGGTTSSDTSTLTVRNTGNKSGSYTLASGSGFTVSPTTGTLDIGAVSPSITVTAPACTTVGTQSVNITGAASLVSVTRVCNPANPMWATAANTAFAAGTVGGTTASVPITLTNTGNAAGNYTISVTNGFTASPSSGTLAIGASVTITATAPICASTANQTAVITFGGSSSATNNLTRGCNPAMVTPPPMPTNLTFNVSSNGRMFVSWTETANTTDYEFAGTFDGSPLGFSSPIAARGAGSSGAVMLWNTTPEDPAKQNKPLCVQLRARNSGGSSALTSAVCATYRYYTALSVQSVSTQPTVVISQP